MFSSDKKLLFAGAVLAAGAVASASAGRRREAVVPAAAGPEPVELPAPQPEETADARGKRRFSRKSVLALAALVAAVGAGIAIAAWTVTGSGSGYAKASTVTPLTLADASAATTADLAPGRSGDVKLSVTNGNGFGVTITSVAGNGTITSNKGAACDASTGVTFANQAVSVALAAGETKTVTLAGAVSMTNASDNSCQGAVFTIPVSVTGQTTG